MAFDLDDEELKATRKLNGSDKNVGSMKEDIKILEVENYYLEELGYLRENNHFIKFNQALKNLIKAYKELEEENKFLRNQELGYIAGYEDGKKHKMTAVAMRNENMKYELYERHIKALKKRIEDLLSIEEHRKENYIPVSLVEEKIKELKQEGNYKTLENPDGRVHFQAEPCDYKIQVLEELLGKGK